MTELNELNLETAVPANLDEWLRGFFDGARHHVGGRPNVLFPRADISFGQGKPATPLAGNDDSAPGVEIRCVTLNVVKHGASQCAYDAPTWSGKLAEDVVLFQFQVRAKQSGTGESQLRTAQVSQLLHAVLNNPLAREPIARAGITHLQARKPEILPQTDYALRLVYCTARLSYPIYTNSLPDDGSVLTLTDENGNQITDENGNPLTVTL